jgi:glycosyltransferase involved in cell wall biosynthesis
MVPGEELARAGHNVRQVSLGDLKAAIADPEFFKRDIFVFGKAFAEVSPVMKIIHAAGGRVIVDLCDNVFAPPEDGLKDIYRAILPHADAVVASSDRLKQALSGNLPHGKPVFVIADAVEGERLRPTFNPTSGSVRLLWFGYPNNLPLLRHELEHLSLLTSGRRVELAIVTAWPNAAVSARFPDDFQGIHMRRVEWSPQAMDEELRACDIVIIPSDDSPARLTKSANRVITGLWAGKYVVAWPLPSYEAFSGFAAIGRDFVAGIQQAIANPDRVRDRIGHGQDYIAQYYSPDIIAKAWMDVFKMPGLLSR